MANPAVPARLERAMNVLLTAATVVLAVSVAKQVFAPPLDSRVGVPTKLTDWVPPDSAGVRIGSKVATVSLVVISDPECPVCKSFNTVSTAASRRYQESISITHILIPLEYHKNAIPAILASECTRNEAEFQSFMTTVYEQQELLGVVSWGSIASDAGIRDTARIAECARSPRSASRRLGGAMDYSQLVKFQGTPTVILNGWRLPHPPTPSLLDALIEALLRDENPFTRRKWAKLVESSRLG
jgi:protein-disulfide isomerase